MPKKKYIPFFLACLIVFTVTACPTQNDGESGGNENGEKPVENKPAVINFFNESSFKVDIYKNLNPDYFDPTTLVCSVNPGSTYKATVYASTDQVIGDTFFIRYKVLLATSADTGTSDIRVDAQRDLSNISLVVEKGKTYTKTIPQPAAGQLKYINGYIRVQNVGTRSVQILRGEDILYKLGDQGAYLNPGQNMGYYEIGISSLDETTTLNQIKAFSGSYANFPSFSMERGKLYSFEINGSGVTGPTMSNIDPMRQ